MGLFGLFKKRDNDSSSNESLNKAKAYFNKGEFQEAFRTLSWGFRKDVNFKLLYKLAVECLDILKAYDEKKLFEAVVLNINDSAAFNNLGNFYFDVGQYYLAQTFYEKTIQLDPMNYVAKHDLAICYARCFQISKAVEVLTKTKSNEFWDLYFLYKCKILDKRIIGVQQALTQIQTFLDQQPIQDEVIIPKMKISELQETLQRFLTVPEIETHIRDWHYIQYGSAVLDICEDRDENNYIAGGRYVAINRSYESIKNISSLLKQFTKKLSISIKGVTSLSDRDSDIVGRLFAKELGVGFSYYDSTLQNQDCLIVSSDSSLFQEYEELNTICRGQIVFSLNHNWLDASVICPDIIGFMSQSCNFPWNGNCMRIIDIETRNIERIPLDNREPNEIANDIFEIQQYSKDITNHLDFYLLRKDFLKGIGKQTNDKRYNFMIESPVPGSYFL